jgi:hypothetical protein
MVLGIPNFRKLPCRKMGRFPGNRRVSGFLQISHKSNSRIQKWDGLGEKCIYIYTVASSLKRDGTCMVFPGLKFEPYLFYGHASTPLPYFGGMNIHKSQVLCRPGYHLGPIATWQDWQIEKGSPLQWWHWPVSVWQVRPFWWKCLGAASYLIKVLTTHA